MRIVKTEITISGYEQPFEIQSLQIHAPFGQHHTFELMASISLEDSLTQDDIDQMLGKSLSICFDDGEEQGRFLGMIDEISFGWDSTGSLSLLIEGLSPTIYLDSGPGFKTFEEQSAQAILDEMLSSYPVGSLPELSISDFDHQLAWWMQLQETDYQNILRLADFLGKVAYYDGETFCIGELGESGETQSLLLGQQVRNVSLSVNLAPLHFRVEGYNATEDTRFSCDAENKYHGNNAWVRMAMDKSSVYPAPRVFLNHTVRKQEEVEAIGKRLSARQIHELVSIRGESSEVSLTIGSRISIEMPEQVLLHKALEGEFIITDITHSVDQQPGYINHFTAIPADLAYNIRMKQASAPIGGPLTATVMDVNDPDSLGRVRVNFVGDSQEALSPWLRVLFPYTSFGGAFLCPKVGEKVVVLFEGFQADKDAFVLGSFYFGQQTAASWKHPDGKIIGIGSEKTRLKIDDTEGVIERESSREVCNSDEIMLSAEIEFVLEAKQSGSIDGGQNLDMGAGIVHINKP